jgi:membrane protein YdbS with pleckstrin-like domain
MDGLPIGGVAARMAKKERVRSGVRMAITAFVLILLIIVSLGWVWTGSHQPPPLRTASHVVLAIAALAGVFAVVRIWRGEV